MFYKYAHDFHVPSFPLALLAFPGVMGNTNVTPATVPSLGRERREVQGSGRSCLDLLKNQ